MRDPRRSFTPLSIALAVLILATGLLVQVLRQPVAATGLLRVRVLDVGQGDAILIDTPGNQHVLVDGGPDDRVVTLIGRYLVPPQRFRLVVASHNHQDHVGGLPAVLGRFPIEEVWISGSIHTTATYEQFLRAIQASNARTEVVHAGHTLTLDGVELRVLHPFDDATDQRPADQHETTIVIRATYGAVSVLLTGDLDMDHERALIERDRASLGATVLKVTHHGSQYGSTARFLEAVHPEIAIISVGEGNRYDHPAPEALERLEALDIPIYRTDQHGTIAITSDGVSIWTEAER
ncbi:MBL fold metallo-hydrolase [Candidatus Berkelbacteria bacterium]|nr:MBL fold metallo-hydrolase [Candidatus Berkelbacteria bacterium]